MRLSKLSSKGQITIPKHIRNVLEITEGDNVAFIEENGLVIMLKANLQSLHDLQDLVDEGALNQMIQQAQIDVGKNRKVE